MERAGIVLEGTERQQWSFVPFVSVGPLQFGMGRDQVVAALDGDLPSAEVIGKWAVFHLSAGHGQALATYFSASGNLACVAIEARQGPRSP